MHLETVNSNVLVTMNQKLKGDSLNYYTPKTIPIRFVPEKPCNIHTPCYLCTYNVCYYIKKSSWSQTTVIVAKQTVLVTIQIYWFRPKNSVFY